MTLFHQWTSYSIHAGLGGREVDLDVNALLAAALRCSLIPISVAALEGKDDGCGVTSSRLVHQKRYKFVFFKFPALCPSRGYAPIFGSHTAPGAVIDLQGAGNRDLESPLAARLQPLPHVTARNQS